MTPTPVVTLNDSSSLTDAQNYPAFDLTQGAPSTFFSFSSARIAQAGPNDPRNFMVAGIQNTNLGDSGTLAASWTSDAPILELPLYAQYATLRLTVDGNELINACQNQNSSPFAMPPINGDIKTIRIDWTQSGGREMRHYRVEVGGFFAGARVSKDDIFYATAEPPKLRVAFVGDSYTEGTSANSPWESFPAICARELNVEPILLGSGGTGYIAIPYAGRFTFIDRLSDLTNLSPPPDAIVVAGGINDSVPPEILSSAVSSYLDALQTSFPLARIIVLGPWNPLLRDGDANAEAIKATTLAHGLPFVDVRDWLPPANLPAYIGPDNVHPTPLGHQYLGSKVADALKPLLPLPDD